MANKEKVMHDVMANKEKIRRNIMANKEKIRRDIITNKEKVTSIQVEKDVYNRLNGLKKVDKQTFNDVLRELLEMNDPFEGMTPERYEAVIKIKDFDPRDTKNVSFLESLDDKEGRIMEDLYIGELYREVLLSGFPVDISSSHTLKISGIEAPTLPEMSNVLAKIASVLPVEVKPSQIRTCAMYPCAFDSEKGDKIKG